jgi:hypothetical protein
MRRFVWLRPFSALCSAARQTSQRRRRNHNRFRPRLEVLEDRVVPSGIVIPVTSTSDSLSYAPTVTVGQLQATNFTNVSQGDAISAAQPGNTAAGQLQPTTYRFATAGINNHGPATAQGTGGTIDLSTGLDVSGNLISTGAQADGNWTVQEANGTTAAAQTVFPNNADFYGGWPANGPHSDWIARDANTSRQGAAPYTFTRTFDLTGYNLSTVFLSGDWNVDDTGTLALNGHAIDSATNPWANNGLFRPFSVSGSSGLFNQGLNTLTITITFADNIEEAVRVDATLAPASPVAGTTLYITNESPTAIQKLDLATNTLTTVLATPDYVDSLVFDNNGDIVYTLAGSGQLGLLNPNTGANSIIASGGSATVDVTLEPGGNSVLVTNRGLDQINRVNLSTGAVSTLVGLSVPNGTAYDNQGSLFAVETGSDSLVQLDPTTGAILQRIPLSTNGYADGLTFDPVTGAFWIANTGGLIEVTNYLSSPQVHRFASPIGGTFDGIESDGQGHIFIADGGHGVVEYTIASNTFTALTSLDIDDLAPITGAGAPPPLTAPTSTVVSPVTVDYHSIAQQVSVSAQVTSSGTAVTQGSVSFTITDASGNVIAQTTTAVPVDATTGTAATNLTIPAGRPAPATGTPEQDTITATYSSGTSALAASSGTAALTINPPGPLIIPVTSTQDALNYATTVTTAQLQAANFANVTLRDAINAADNSSAEVPGNTYTIQLQPATYQFTTPDNSWFGPNALPPVTANIVIAGNGATLFNTIVPAPDLPSERFFFVSGGELLAPGLAPGSLTLKDLTLLGGRAVGGAGGTGGGGLGAGGAIFTEGPLTLVNVTLAANSAVGGEPSGGSGAGGGMGGFGSVDGAGGGFTSFFPFVSFNDPAGASGGLGARGVGLQGGGGGAGFGQNNGGNGSQGVAGLGGGAFGGGFDTGFTKGGDGGLQQGLYSALQAGAGGGFGQGGSFPGGGGGIGGGGGASLEFSSDCKGGSGGFGGGGGVGSTSLNGSGGPGGDGGFGGGGGGGGGFGGNGSVGAGGSGGFGGGSGSTGLGPNFPGEGGGGAGMGGAIFSLFGTVTAINCTFSANRAQGGSILTLHTNAQPGQGLGGAIFNADGTIILADDTFAFNAAFAGQNQAPSSPLPPPAFASDGADVYNFAIGTSATKTGLASLTLTNSILANPNAGVADLANVSFNSSSVPTATVAGNTNLVMSYAEYNANGIVTGATPGLATGVITEQSDPQLGRLQSNGGLEQTRAIAPSSPAFGTGNIADLNQLLSQGVFPVAANGQPVDERGLPRIDPLRGQLDLGAFEYQATNVSQSLPTFTMVTPVSVTFDVQDQVVPLSAQTDANGAGVTLGSVSFTITDANGNVVAQTTTAVPVDSTGMASTTLTVPASLPVFADGIPGGQYTITANYTSGTPLLAKSSGAARLTVSPATPVITADRATATYHSIAGDTVTLQAHVRSPQGTDVNEGQLTFTFGNQTFAATNNGNGNFTAAVPIAAGTPQGTYGVSASYSDPAIFSEGGGSGGNFFPGENVASVRIQPAPTVTTVPPISIPFGDARNQVLLHAAVTSPFGTVLDGTVDFTVQDAASNTINVGPVVQLVAATGPHAPGDPPAPVVMGVADVLVQLPSGILGGAYQVQAVYVPAAAGNFLSSQTSGSLTVTQPPSSVPSSPPPAGSSTPPPLAPKLPTPGPTPTPSPGPPILPPPLPQMGPIESPAAAGPPPTSAPTGAFALTTNEGPVWTMTFVTPNGGDEEFDLSQRMVGLFSASSFVFVETVLAGSTVTSAPVAPDQPLPTPLEHVQARALRLGASVTDGDDSVQLVERLLARRGATAVKPPLAPPGAPVAPAAPAAPADPTSPKKQSLFPWCVWPWLALCRDVLSLQGRRRQEIDSAQRSGSAN